MEIKKEQISPALAQEIVDLINQGGWAHVSRLGYPYPNGPVTAEIKNGFLAFLISPKRQARCSFMVYTDPDCKPLGHRASPPSVETWSDPRPELIRLSHLTGAILEERWQVYNLIHRSNHLFNIRRRRRQISGRLKRRGVECSWSKNGQLVLTFADGTTLPVR